MSDKLVVEFYAPEDRTRPVACVLALHGGDNPSVAATTLANFFEAVSCLKESRFEDAGLLAARFVAWESSKGTASSQLDFVDVALLPFEKSYGYQTVRVHAEKDRPYVHCVRDEWARKQELREAAVILGQLDVNAPQIPAR